MSRSKKKEKRRELTIREWQDKLCADAGHEAATLNVKGRPTFFCFECDAYWCQMELRGRPLEMIAGGHFTAN